MKRVVLLLLVIVSAGMAQSVNQTPSYSSPDIFSGSAGEAITVQLPANSIRGVSGAYVSGSVTAAATICFSFNGTAATATANPIVVLPGFPPSVASVFHTSNVGQGTAGPCFVLQAGAFNFKWSDFYFPKASSIANQWGLKPWTSVQNFTATLTPATGTISGNLNPNWYEQ